MSIIQICVNKNTLSKSFRCLILDIQFLILDTIAQNSLNIHLKMNIQAAIFRSERVASLFYMNFIS